MYMYSLQHIWSYYILYIMYTSVAVHWQGWDSVQHSGRWRCRSALHQQQAVPTQQTLSHTSEYWVQRSHYLSMNIIISKPYFWNLLWLHCVVYITGGVPPVWLRWCGEGVGWHSDCTSAAVRTWRVGRWHSTGECGASLCGGMESSTLVVESGHLLCEQWAGCGKGCVGICIGSQWPLIQRWWSWRCVYSGTPLNRTLWNKDTFMDAIAIPWNEDTPLIPTFTSVLIRRVAL